MCPCVRARVRAWPSLACSQNDEEGGSNFCVDSCFPNAHRKPIARALLCPDGKTILTASLDGRLRGWSAATLESTFSLTVVPAPPLAVQQMRHGRTDYLTDFTIMPISNRYASSEHP